jgi:hypothetical protein
LRRGNRERVNAQRVAVFKSVSQHTHGLKIANIHGRQYAMRDLGPPGARAHDGHIMGQFWCVKVAVGVDPESHEQQGYEMKKWREKVAASGRRY